MRSNKHLLLMLFFHLSIIFTDSNRAYALPVDLSYSVNTLTNLQGLYNYTYNALNLRETMQYLNGITTSYTYDELSRLTAAGNQLSTINYTYDTMWNRTSMTNEYGEYRYDYDSIYQLIGVSGVQNFSFAYDPVGNRTAGYTTNNLNQYTAVGTTAYTYDNDGNLTSNGTNTYTYDYENRLVSATAGVQNFSFAYDGFSRRISKTIDNAITNYLYDGDNLLVEYNQNWEPIRYYAYSDNIDEPITITNTNSTYYYHADGLGSITHITDSNGNLVEKYQYDAYGKPIILDVSNQPLAISSVGNRFMFTAREYDTESSLYYYRNRYYDPAIGRFLQTDPLGYWDGPNLYTYVHNNPVNWVDPWGLAKWRQRPLDSKFFRTWAGGSTGSYSGGPFHHDQFFFDDKQKPSNLGFFKDGVHEDRASNWLQSQYETVVDNLDDSTLRQALAEVAEDFGKYEGLGNNCQDFAEAVMKRYFELMEEDAKSKCK